jgi:DNA-binding PucR family transcriptional regulator
MAAGVGVVVRRLRARQGEIEEAIYGRVREVVSDPRSERDSEYVAGLRAAVGAAVEFGLAGIEQQRGERVPAAIPVEAVVQARRGARNGVSLDAILRRYIAGHALLWDYVMEEADRVDLPDGGGLREMSRVQALLLDQLVIGVTREHVDELRRAGRSAEQRLLERVRLLLDGERASDTAELGYELDVEHIGMIVQGAGAQAVLRDLARRADRRLLSVEPGEETVWAWLGGREGVEMSVLSHLLTTRELGEGELVFAFGEPARGPEGWRQTHRQAQAALLVALRQPQPQRRPRQPTRYADVALLAAALKDDTLSRSLSDTYLTPLDDRRNAGPVLRETLRAYLAAEHNVSSTAAALGVVRTTIENRLRTIEQRLGRPLHPCSAELEIALRLDELTTPQPPPQAPAAG